MSNVMPNETIFLPTFEMAANPTVSLSEVSARRFYLIDRAQIRARENIQRDEDVAIFNAINAATSGPRERIEYAQREESASILLASIKEAEREERVLLKQAKIRVKNPIFELEL
jgi:hypothetical protein